MINFLGKTKIFETRLILRMLSFFTEWKSCASQKIHKPQVFISN